MASCSLHRAYCERYGQEESGVCCLRNTGLASCCTGAPGRSLRLRQRHCGCPDTEVQLSRFIAFLQTQLALCISPMTKT